MELYEIVKKLVGNIEPYGDSNIDEQRLSNINNHIILTQALIRDLVDVAEFKNRLEFSIKKLGTVAYDGLEEIKEMIND